MTDVERIKAAIRDVPDFPKPGILFKDITPVLADPELFAATVAMFVDRLRGKQVDCVAAIDARGFIFGGAVAHELGVSFVPIRKKGKLPHDVHEESYDLEYGTETLAIHKDALAHGKRVAIMDDLLATGGTAAASARLIERAGGEVVELDFLIELKFLDGRRQLDGYDVFCPITF